MGGGADLSFGFSRWLCGEWVLGCDGFEAFPAWVAGMGVLEQESVGWSKNLWVDGCRGFCS